MALAFLQYSGREGAGLEFQVDLGTNRFFTWAVGDGVTVQDGGPPRLAHPRFVSEVQGPVEDTLLGRTRLDVPAGALDRENRFVQVVSYRTAGRVGPAVSEVVAVPFVDVVDGPAAVDEARRNGMTSLGSASSGAVRDTRAGVVPFPHREMDSAMFLDGLGSLLGSILPGLSSILPGLSSALPGLEDLGTAVARLLGGAGGAPPVAAASPAKASPADLQKLIDAVTRIAQALKPPAPSPAAAPPQPPAADAQALSARPARRNGYSQAQIAPALLALMNPQMIQAVTDALAKLGVLAIKNDENLRDWIKQLNPDVNDAGLDSLLQTLAVEAIQPAQDVAFRPVARVSLRAESPAPVTLGGRARTLLRAGQDLGFRFTIDTPKPIPKATLLLAVKEPGTSRTLVRKGFRLERVVAGSLSPTPVVPRALLAPLQPGGDYVLSATLVWTGKAGDRLGVTAALPFTLAGAWAFDRVEGRGEVRPLSDVERHRDFWHKAWQATLDDQVRSYALDCKYYYSLDAAATANARLETLVRTDAQGVWGQQGRLKSGLAMSLSALNALLPELAGKSLEAAQLEALSGGDFASRFSTAARTKVAFRGRRGDSVALWIYPEVELQPLVLQRVDQVDALGAVTRLAEARATFPMPVSCHFIGVSTQS